MSKEEIASELTKLSFNHAIQKSMDCGKVPDSQK